MSKRIFDLFFSFLGLLLLSPLFFIVGIIIRLDGGPVLFRQKRVGLHGKIFKIFKFRTMIPDAEKYSIQVTAGHDPRITRIGSFLRKTKIDELPQLINVFLGQMSLVGPRPEVPFYVDKWSDTDRQILLPMRPGITDYASVIYRDEELVLSKADDPERVYMEKVMPHKLKLCRKYAEEQTLLLDLRIIIATFFKVIGLKIDLLPELT